MIPIHETSPITHKVLKTVQSLDNITCGFYYTRGLDVVEVTSIKKGRIRSIIGKFVDSDREITWQKNGGFINGKHDDYYNGLLNVSEDIKYILPREDYPEYFL